MKKILFPLIVIAGIVLFAGAPQNFIGFKDLLFVQADTVEAREVIVIDNDTFKATTQTNPLDTTLATQAYVDAGGAAGVSVLGFDPNTGIANISTATVLVDTASFEGRFGYLTTDTLKVQNDSLLLGNDKGIPIVDLTAFLDGIYVNVADSASSPGYVTNVALNDTLTNYATTSYVDSAIVDFSKTGYPLTLPIAGTLAGSVALMVEGTDYPTGWVITTSGNDLKVEHSLGRYTTNTTVKYNTSGNSYRQLRNFADAYAGVLDVDNNNVTIESVAFPYYTSSKVRIFISFE